MRISTGKNVDDILCGGMETSAVTEFYGAHSDELDVIFI